MLSGPLRRVPQPQRLHAERAVPRSDANALLTTAAHELRHPLHVMRMALARDLPENHPARLNLERYIDRMNRLIQDVVEYVRTEEGTLELQLEAVDVHQLLIELMDDYRTTFDARKIRLSVLAPTGLSVQADRQRLLQVLANLLDNALKFTPRSGAVTVEARSRDQSIVIGVRDTGVGLSIDGDAPPGVSALLIGPQGLGIGLAVAKRIVELHAGTLTIRSDRPEHGTEALVTLPAPAGRSTP